MPRIATWDNVLLAHYKAHAGKGRPHRRASSVIAADDTINAITEELADGGWKPGPYQSFVVHDPKRRVIHAAPMRDRIVHHALMNHVAPVLERGAVEQSYACRKERGTHAALQQALRCTRRQAWYLKLDIRKYFDSVDHEILRGLLRRTLRERPLLSMMDHVIGSYATTPGRGIPIGTLTSQYFANYYLDAMDHWTMERLKCSAYVRYMDDFVLWHDDDAVLRGWLQSLREWLCVNRGLELKGDPQPRPCRDGVAFLGYRLTPRGVLLGRGLRKRIGRRFQRYEQLRDSGSLSELALQRRTDAMLAVIRVAHTSAWRRRLLSRLPSATEQ